MYYILSMTVKKTKKESNKWTDTETSAWTGLVRAQQYLLNKVEEALKEQGFPPLTWYDMLWELDRAPDGSLRLNEIGKRVLLDKYNVTRLMQRLEDDGLVSRSACPVDGRGVFACITDKGRKLRKAMWPVYEKAVSENFLSQFGKKEIAELSGFMDRIKPDIPE
jgi:DNA-binding MarR family transcriptional regulator